MFVQLFSCLLSVCCRWSSLSSCRLHVTHLQAVWQDIVKAKQNCTRSSWTSPRAAEDGLKLYYLHRGTGLLDEEPPRLRGKATSLQEWLGARCMRQRRAARDGASYRSSSVPHSLLVYPSVRLECC
ncbi:hypothetical protein ABBQ32_000685 [Trebouxia sp. C0010 RCD-2024]